MQKQVFQTNSSTRWKSFVWAFRLLLVFLVVIITSVVISLIHKHDYDLKVLTYNAKKLPDLNTDKTKTYISKAEEAEFAKQLKQYRLRHRKSFYPGSTPSTVSSEVKKFMPVRAGFYVNWDQNSKFSLEKNISKMNMVIPEWYFIDNSKGKLDCRVEENTLEYLRKNNVAVVPMLSNFKQWATDSTYILLKNEKYRKHLIDQIETLLDTNDYKGINIDFENYPYKIKPYLIQFSKELHERLHPEGYITTIDVNPTDDYVWYKELAPYYDFIFSMAYNEHYPDGEPGSISSLMFVEKALDDAMKDVPSEKIVLCLGGYGFDWPVKGGTAQKVTYQNMISLAKEYDEKVYFNLSQSDITLLYTDDEGKQHEAHCNDAVGTFNIMRTAEDYNAGGVALWYLGSEDQRMWNYFNANLNEEYLSKHPFNYKKLEHIEAIDAINYDGKGEILEIINKPVHGYSKFTYDTKDQLITNEEYKTLPSAYLLKRYGADNPKKLAITFDDGPSSEYTPKILDILKKYKVPATFFVTGVNIENNIPLVRRIYREGHEIGNHTFTHPNLEVTSEARERIELRSTRLLIESILGRSTLLFRAPYVIDAEPKNLFQMKSLAVAHDEGFISATSYIDPNDWQEDIESDTIVARAKAFLKLDPEKRGNIILLHDAGGDRTATIEALPEILEYYKMQGYQFVTVSELMGKTRDQVMPAVESKFHLTEKLDMIFFSITYAWDHFLNGFFMVAIFLVMLRLISVAILAVYQRIREKKHPIVVPNDFKPKVSVIVPAYNEELNAVRTVNTLLKSTYDDLEVIFVDDGSKDETFARVSAAFEGNSRVSVLTKPNGGKAAALNYGIERANGEILVCIDADTVLPPNAIPLMIPYFADPEVGAVAGNVRVGNTVNLLTNWQSIEYITSQNFDRRAYDAVNAILVVPGAIGAFRKTAMEAVNGFTTDTLAEDCDLTLRILREGYRIRTCNEALALTEAPESLNMFLKQRSRWTFGMMQSFWKHRDMLFTSGKLNISWVALPNLLIFNFIIPFFSPIVDILFIAGLFTYAAPEYITFYLLYFVIDCIISFMAYRFDNQKFSLKTALFLFVQRFIYRQLLFYVLFKSYKKAIKGELVSWGVLKRTGNVKDEL